jgi:hypothetical protein
VKPSEIDKLMKNPEIGIKDKMEDKDQIKNLFNCK